MVVSIPDPQQRAQMAITVALPNRISLVSKVSEMMTYLLNTVYSTGEMGTIMNIEAHSLVNVLYNPEKLLGFLMGGCDVSSVHYVGCYIDEGEPGRDLNGPSTSLSSMVTKI